jgi:hypothetical protein
MNRSLHAVRNLSALRLRHSTQKAHGTEIERCDNSGCRIPAVFSVRLLTLLCAQSHVDRRFHRAFGLRPVRVVGRNFALHFAVVSIRASLHNLLRRTASPRHVWRALQLILPLGPPLLAHRFMIDCPVIFNPIGHLDSPPDPIQPVMSSGAGLAQAATASDLLFHDVVSPAPEVRHKLAQRVSDGSTSLPTPAPVGAA